MKDLADRFMDLFAGLDRAYGTYEVTSNREDGKQTGKAKTIRGTITVDLWEKHLDGGRSLGVVPINDASSCKFGAIDIDVYDGVDVSKIFDVLEKYKLRLFPCRSKSGGIHLYLFCSEWVPAQLIQRKLKEIAALIGYGNSEIFPKQTQILADRGDIGGWINMPYFGCRSGDGTSRAAVTNSGDVLSSGDFIESAHSGRYSKKDLNELRFIKDDDLPDGPPCLQILVKDGFPEGTRNDGLFNLGVYLRKAHPDSWREEIERYNVKYLKPPLSSTEVQVIIKSVGKKDYIYTCSRPPISLHCNIGLCRTRRCGVGDGKKLPPIHSLTKYDTDPPIWFLDVDGGGRLELTTEDLQNQRRFQKRCMETLNKIPSKIKEEDWIQLLNTLLEEVNIIEAPKEATPSGQFMFLLEKFCTSRMQGREIEDILMGKTFFNESGKHCFRLNDFMMFLQRQHFKEFGLNKITAVLKMNGAEHHFKHIKGRGVNYWSVPQMGPIDLPGERRDADPAF